MRRRRPLVFLSLVLLSVSHEAPPRAPVSVELEDSVLRWTPAEGDSGTTHTVQSRGFGSKGGWTDVSWCVRLAGNSCNVSSLTRDAEHGCVSFRVQRDGSESGAVEACGRSGDSCTPEMSLSAGPGALKVRLSRDHPLIHEEGNHLKYQILFGREGDPLGSPRTQLSSDIRQNLDPGQNYCVQVQFTHFSKPVGLPRCPECTEIPFPDSKHSRVLAVVLPLVLLTALVVSVVYVLLFHRKKVKEWLKPQPLPDSLCLPVNATPLATPLVTPLEDHCSIITAFTEQTD